MTWDLRFPAMGTQAHVLIDGPAELLPIACERIDRLEQLWSRFIAESDVSRLNRGGESSTRVASETIELIQRALEGWEMTEGLFDPTLLNELVAAGYDRDFREVRARGAGPAPATPPRRSAGPVFPVSLDETASQASIAGGVGFDSGGIGKGLAADLVCDALLERGASAALVNLGGDLRSAGRSAERPWKVGLDNPFDPSGPEAIEVSLSDRALATTTSLVRRWRQDGEDRHHLIDPTTGQPCASDIASVTVIADRGWKAEALAKAAFISGGERAPELLAAHGATGLTVDWRGRIHLGPGMEPFLTLPASHVASISLKDRALAKVQISLPAAS